MIIAEGYQWTENADGSYTTTRPYMFGRPITAHAFPVSRAVEGYEPLGDYGDNWTLYTMLHPDLSDIETFRVGGVPCAFLII